MTRVVGIVQARMGSSRLPGKSLMDLVGRPVTMRVLERAGRARHLDAVVLATSDLPADDPLAERVAAEGALVFRGPEADVLARYQQAAAAHDAEVVVRITADCPLLDPDVLDAVVGDFLATPGEVDYVSNVIARTYPKGLDVQAFSRAALEVAAAEATTPLQREHVTTFFYDHPARFRRRNVAQAVDRSEWRWTLDYAEDLAFMRAIFDRLAEPFGQEEVAALLGREPGLIDLLGEHAWDRARYGPAGPGAAPGA